MVENKKKKGLPIWAIVLIVIGVLYIGYNLIIIVIGANVASNAIDEAQDNANKTTITNYAKDLESEYMVAMVQGANLEWIDAEGKIDFSKAPKYSYANIVCTGDSYINKSGKVTLNDCSVGDSGPIYHYKNNQAISDNGK